MLVDTEKKSDARKEELQSKTKQCEKLENIINDLQNKVRMHLHRVGLSQEVGLLPKLRCISVKREGNSLH